MFEYEKGHLAINEEPNFEGLREFLSKQGRFESLTEDQYQALDTFYKQRWKKIQGLSLNNDI